MFSLGQVVHKYKKDSKKEKEERKKERKKGRMEGKKVRSRIGPDS